MLGLMIVPPLVLLFGLGLKWVFAPMGSNFWRTGLDWALLGLGVLAGIALLIAVPTMSAGSMAVIVLVVAYFRWEAREKEKLKQGERIEARIKELTDRAI
jgi:hypothetical protein